MVPARQVADHRGDPIRVGQGCGLLPLRGGGQRAPGLDGLPFALGHHGEVAALAHDGDHAGHALDRRRIDRPERRARAGLAHGPGMQHARQPQILDEGGATRDLGRDVHARQGGADHLVGCRVLQPSAGLGRDVQRQAGRKLAIGQRTPVRRVDRAVPGLQPRRG